MGEAARFSGGYSEEVTPVPIPNTVVKLLSAEGTWRATAWEIMSPPEFESQTYWKAYYGYMWFGLDTPP